MATQANRRLSQFSQQDLIISDRSLRTPYRQRTNEIKSAIHWGQRKLHLSEVEFFTIYWDPRLIANPLCVYAGAAPGTHISLLSQMFPAFTFHLYDPADFDIEESDKIKLFKEYFTEEVAARYSGRADVFFVSDIRTADYKSLQREALAKRGITEFNNDGSPKGPIASTIESYKEAEVKNEDQIWGDMDMQQQWVIIMNPEHALLKFRLPYVIDGNERVVQYLKGIVYWQVWAPQTSTETRLKPIRNASGLYEIADWNTLEYEQWCFHHNTSDRQGTFYENPFTGNNDPIDYPELLNDYDSVAEAFILRMYLEKLGVVENVYKQVKRLSSLMTISINHYRTDDKGAKTLASKRSSPVKSSSKAALDAFRNKRTGRPVQNIAFQHTKVDINPTWRQEPIPPRTQSIPIIRQTHNITVPPPARSPAIVPPPARSPAIVPPPARSPAIFPPPARSPAIIPPPARSPTIIPPAIPPPARSPTIIPPTIPPPARSPTIIPPTIPPPARSPIVAPVTISAPLIQPVRNPSVPLVTPLIQPVRNPSVPVVAPLIQPVRNPSVPVVAPIIQPVRNPSVPIVQAVTTPVMPTLPRLTTNTPRS